jgi:DNA repair protein RadC
MGLIGADSIYEAPRSLLAPTRPNPVQGPVYGEIPDVLPGANLTVRTALVRTSRYAAASKRAPKVDNPSAIAQLVKHLGVATQEHFVVIVADAKGRLLAIQETGLGGTAGIGIELAHVVKVFLLVPGAAKLYIVHNHPAGSATPSEEDNELTLAVARAMHCLGAQLDDHVIVSYSGYYSYRYWGRIEAIQKKVVDECA